jgi:hypothetical protein
MVHVLILMADLHPSAFEDRAGMVEATSTNCGSIVSRFDPLEELLEQHMSPPGSAVSGVPGGCEKALASSVTGSPVGHHGPGVMTGSEVSPD